MKQSTNCSGRKFFFFFEANNEQRLHSKRTIQIVLSHLTQRCAHSVLRSWQHCVTIYTYILFLLAFGRSLSLSRSFTYSGIWSTAVSSQLCGSVKSECPTYRSVAKMACRRNNVSETAVDSKPHINGLNDYKNSVKNFHQNGFDKQLANGYCAKANGFGTTMVCAMCSITRSARVLVDSCEFSTQKKKYDFISILVSCQQNC